MVKAGHCASALKLLEGFEHWKQPYRHQALLAHARIALATGSTKDVEDVLNRFGEVLTGPPLTPEAQEATVIAARVHCRNENFAAASAAAQAVMAEATGDIRDEAAYVFSLSEWSQHKYDPTLPEALGLLEAKGSIGYALGLTIKSWMYFGLEETVQQIPLMRAALESMQAMEEPDLFIMAKVLVTISAWANDFADVALYEFANEVFHTLPWTSELMELNLMVRRSLALMRHVLGQSDSALELLREGLRFPSSTFAKVQAHLEIAEIAKNLGEHRWSMFELYEAHSIAGSCVWATTTEFEREALLMLARLFASVNVDQARIYYSRYAEITTAISAGNADSHGKKFLLYERLASAAIQRATGNTQLAKKMYQGAYETSQALGKTWYSCKAAYALYELGNEAQWLKATQEAVSVFPDSYLATSIDLGKSTDEDYRGLTPAQRQVFNLYATGVSKNEIMAKLKIKGDTVNNHIKVLYSVFNVHSQPKLMALARERGIPDRI